MINRKGEERYSPNQFQLLTVKDVQRDEAAIIEVLSGIMNEEIPNDLELLNYYREVPVSFGATVEFIERGVVDMTVHTLQSVTMLLQNMTIIKSRHLPHCVIARVLKIYRKRNLALLNQFSYVHIPAEQRKYVRVIVSDRVEAAFHADREAVHGTISEFSYGGVSILAPQGSVFKENARGIITLSLPGNEIGVPGLFLRAYDQNSLKRYIFKLETDNKNERIISQFIFGQQVMILRELKDMCLY
ncbi:MAG TPA: PilZ domain-containing protein [Geobacteraceae bacterium]|nr:PilZ domain-containing protein [Geobacteraceae bacterium]